MELNTCISFIVVLSCGHLRCTYSFVYFSTQVKAGAILNLWGVLIVTLATSTWMMAYFDLDTLPWDPDQPLNASTIAPAVTCVPI